MPQTRVRVVGSGFTTLKYAGRDIAFLDSFQDSGQRAFGGPGGGGPGYEAIHPLGSKHPVEIATSRVLSAGTIQASVRELWNEPVWYQLAGLAGRQTIVDVWETLANTSSSVTCQMIIRPPGGGRTRGKVYHGCVVTSIDDGENVTIGALSVARNIEIAYTHTTAL